MCCETHKRFLERKKFKSIAKKTFFAKKKNIKLKEWNVERL